MSKVLSILTGVSIAVAALMGLGTSSSRADNSSLLLDIHPHPSYANCVNHLKPNDRQGACECYCKHSKTRTDMSSKECLTDVCGVGQGGIEETISLGPVFNGDLFEELPAAADSCQKFISGERINDDQHYCVMKSFTPVTLNPDSWMIHVINSLPDFDSGNIVVESGSIACVQGLNQDSSSLAGCQRGFGCREQRRDINIVNGCVGRDPNGAFLNLFGCCLNDGTASSPACPALSGDSFAGSAAYDGLYGATPAQCRDLGTPG